ncbi:hypothetical protein A2763_02450 [Candidatus Kaiserbacteria bacterium RIFCSPHIGHO2_01_FULL_54_36]|uniref:Uncharacterized protein n=1 Tax=Candidatus Kaiserbacteria bacterium RIFCSPHIGHO2_01_FULL_54_36 TaxID=1798482 RepID=A0A1F6CPH4_9BACT|nr:MAG: hypothetical protein A2763_02450 [Candidatus Kaiserbacteria bacterium RIFCSPHIGHO2_01_FULL_54_36]OGG75492.1 MAG: hypothetical protein A3A41_00300 [Candidatus Kaiserbacteria bacterium RIFCSPLOWO2_01_FULL_54_22]
MSDDEYQDDPTLPRFINRFIGLSERLLASQKSANLLIIVLILLTIIPAFGVGILVTRLAAPHPTQQSN